MDDLKRINEELGITIIINLHFVDLAKEYGCKNLGKCPMHKVGDVFYGDYAKP